MARLEVIVDDFTGAEGAKTRQFMGPDGVVREVDLSDDSAAELEEALAPFIAVSRPAGRGPFKKKPHVASASLDPDEEAKIRKWAEKYEPQELRDMATEAGYRDVPQRGRVPIGALQMAYKAEHGTKPAKAKKTVVTVPQTTEQRNAVREWARGQGWDISDRGKISEEILEAFAGAHQNNYDPFSVR